MQGKRVVVSGSGNVACYAVQKLLELGAVPITMSDSTGYVMFKVMHVLLEWGLSPYEHSLIAQDGITDKEANAIMELKTVKRGSLSSYKGAGRCALMHKVW